MYIKEVRKHGYRQYIMKWITEFKTDTIAITYIQISKNGKKQIDEKKKYLLAILNLQIQKQTGFEDDQIEEVYQAISNIYKNLLNNILDYENELLQYLQNQFGFKCKSRKSDSEYRIKYDIIDKPEFCNISRNNSVQHSMKFSSIQISHIYITEIMTESEY